MSGQLEHAIPSQLGRYRVLGRLGAGGMAEVYLARAARGRGPVAIKRIRPALVDNRQYRCMFAREAATATRLKHQNICQVHEYVEDGDEPFIAMEYLEGATLEEIFLYLKGARRRLPPLEVCRLVAQAAEGLAAVHALSDGSGNVGTVMHRDVSPANLFVTTEGTLKLLDFGIAKSLEDPSMTRDGAVRGKFAYMSPERLTDGSVDHRADLFALGAVLFELLTQTRMFFRESDYDTIRAVVSDRIPRADEFRKIPREIADIVERATARCPESRFQSAREFADSLWGVVGDMRSAPSTIGAFVRGAFSHRIASTREMCRLSISLAAGTSPPLSAREGSSGQLDTRVIGKSQMAALVREAKKTEPTSDEPTRLATVPLVPRAITEKDPEPADLVLRETGNSGLCENDDEERLAFLKAARRIPQPRMVSVARYEPGPRVSIEWKKEAPQASFSPKKRNYLRLVAAAWLVSCVVAIAAKHIASAI